MDIVKALRELYAEKKRLDAAIASLEARTRAAKTGSPSRISKGQRGRKSMSAAERLEVSKRMTSYWEARRARMDAQVESSQSTSDEQSTSTTTSGS